MKGPIAFLFIALLTLGSAVGDTSRYFDMHSAEGVGATPNRVGMPTEAQIAAWKATATTTDYTPPSTPR